MIDVCLSLLADNLHNSRSVSLRMARMLVFLDSVVTCHVASASSHDDDEKLDLL